MIHRLRGEAQWSDEAKIKAADSFLVAIENGEQEKKVLVRTLQVLVDAGRFDQLETTAGRLLSSYESLSAETVSLLVQYYLSTNNSQRAGDIARQASQTSEDTSFQLLFGRLATGILTAPSLAAEVDADELAMEAEESLRLAMMTDALAGPPAMELIGFLVARQRNQEAQQLLADKAVQESLSAIELAQSYNFLGLQTEAT